MTARALQNYDARLGALPPNLRGPAGEDVLSWRVAILPDRERQPFFDQIIHDESWDSPTNKPIVATMDGDFDCPRDGRGDARTNYFAVTGPGTLWPPEGPRSLDDVPDGADVTLMLIEKSPAEPWAKPVDVSFDEALVLLTSPVVPRENGGHEFSNVGFFEKPGRCRTVAMPDGAVYQLRCPLPEDLARAILTADGGEPVTREEILAWTGPEPDRSKLARCVLFAIVALLPAARLLKRKSGEA